MNPVLLPMDKIECARRRAHIISCGDCQRAGGILNHHPREAPQEEAF